MAQLEIMFRMVTAANQMIVSSTTGGLRFSLTSVTTHTPVTVHQAFVRLVRSSPYQEVFFVTEQDKEDKLCGVCGWASCAWVFCGVPCVCACVCVHVTN